MNYINSDFILDDQKINKFHKDGFLHLKSFYSPEFISHIKNEISGEISEPKDKYQSGFNRVAFDIFLNDPHVRELLASNAFRTFITKLTNKRLLYTQGLGFELKKNESKGFPWHIGTQSFGYQRAEDFGCTIWTPLVPINTKSQRGGMAYVPKSIVSGDFMYKCVDPAVFLKTSILAESEDGMSMEEFMHLRDVPLNDPAMKKILDFYAVEDDFQIGDALIFDKHVIHRSVQLLEGDVDSRAAFVMRFVCSGSRYDKARALALEIPRKYFNYVGPTRFHLDVCENDGELITQSRLFDKDRDSRLIC